MVDRTANWCLAIAEPDDLFRLGLQRYLQQQTQWVMGLATSDCLALPELLDAAQGRGEVPDLVILGWPGTVGLAADWRSLLRSLKQRWPYLPILLLAVAGDPVVTDAWWLGIEGCCARSSGEAELLAAIEAVAGGETYWAAGMSGSALDASFRTGSGTLVRRSRNFPVWMQIDQTMSAIDQKRRSPQTNLIERWVLAGRQRELRAARWITQRLLPGVPPQPVIAPPAARVPPPPNGPIAPMNDRGLPLATLFDRLAAKLRYPLDNGTELPLEIDILRSAKQRELIYIVLRQFEAIVDELQFSRVPQERLAAQAQAALVDLWRAVLPEFFGKYYQVAVRGVETPVVETLVAQQARVEAEILGRIPLVPELLGYLLFQQPLVVDNQAFAASSPVAIAQASAILENLVIQVANAVIAPLLNQFADVEVIKQAFYDRHRLSTREIERFRNDLSWRYRRDRYVTEPLAIFESQYALFCLTELGITQQTIYAPRRQELESLTGIPFAVTLLWELRDAVAPRLRTATAFVGSGLVYVLTEVIGRGLGLVGRGILKGIGNAFQERP
jgi:DNA-binding NarL/FixJ family response regulator